MTKKSFTRVWEGLEINSENLVPTKNSMGFMLALPDEIMQKFLTFALNYNDYLQGDDKKKGRLYFVDVGSAYGVATLPLLEKGLSVIANDTNKDHLLELLKRTPKKYCKNLILQYGKFPTDVDYMNFRIGGFLVSRLFHFLSGEMIDKSLKLMYENLEKGGKIFISTMSPYLKFLEKFICEYIRKEKSGVQWPGEITNLKKYLPKEFINIIPDFFNVMSHNVLCRALEKNNFLIEEAYYTKNRDI